MVELDSATVVKILGELAGYRYLMQDTSMLELETGRKMYDDSVELTELVKAALHSQSQEVR